MIVVNIFGGPGIGKSTVAAGVFHLLKMRAINCELVTEYAKQLTWEGAKDKLADQLYVTAKQNRALARLQGKVDCVVTDSPLILGHVYGADRVPHLRPLITKLFWSYDNLNYLLARTKPYQQAGRNETEEEAEMLDKLIERSMEDAGLIYTKWPECPDTANRIYQDVVLHLASRGSIT